MKTFGDELKEAVQDNLLLVAREALKLHGVLDGRKFTSADDVQAFRYDMVEIEQAVRDIERDARRSQRYYADVAADTTLRDTLTSDAKELD